MSDKLEGRTVPLVPPTDLKFTLREPYGVVGVVVTWNGPLEGPGGPEGPREVDVEDRRPVVVGLERPDDGISVPMPDHRSRRGCASPTAMAPRRRREFTCSCAPNSRPSTTARRSSSTARSRSGKAPEETTNSEEGGDEALIPGLRLRLAPPGPVARGARAVHASIAAAGSTARSARLARLSPNTSASRLATSMPPPEFAARWRVPPRGSGSARPSRDRGIR